MRLPISQLNHLIDFGVTEQIDTDTIDGSTIDFVPKQRFHCAFYQRSQNQQYSLLGTKLEDTIVVAVRSQYKIDKTMLAQLDGNDDVTYRIITISRDDSHSLQRYDLITLKDVTKGDD
ncbi:phage head closure protein [Limosilactobacillus fastidiosus]|uniref:Phage head closure protein n=1 Tax=Limosilactobacillus fastidiosus TaxID=2759855 RepID=A0ABR6E8W8_9LACO|nr:phage head closure protein [Limosilactobacillus fastidiosus]